MISDRVCYLFLIIACAFSFSTVFFALDYTDTFYHGCNFLLAGKVSIFLPLTQGLYILTCKIFGDYVLAYRIINWLTYFSACILTLFLREQDHNKSLWIWLLSISIICIPLTNTNVFNGNGLSTLFLSLTFIACYKCSLGKRVWYWFLFLAILGSILSRFPNIVVIAVIIIASTMILPSKDIKNILFVSIGALSIALICECLLFGGLSNYIGYFSDKIIQVSTGGNADDHSIGYLFHEYLHTLKDMISDIKYLAILAIIPFLSVFFKNKMVKYTTAIVFIISHIVFLYFRVEIVSAVINYFLLVYLYSNICVLSFIVCITSLINRNIKSFILNLLPLLLSLCAASGSDTGLILIGGPLFVLTPWLIIQLKKQIEIMNIDDYIKVICALFLLGLCAAIYVREGGIWIGISGFSLLLIIVWITGKRHIKCHLQFQVQNTGYSWLRLSISLLLLLDLCLIGNAKLKVSFHDRPIKELRCQYNIPQLKGIWTNPTSKDFLESVLKDYEAASADNPTIFFGRNSALFSYITRTGMVDGVNFSQDDNAQNVINLKNAIKNKPTIFLCPENPAIQSGTTIENYKNTHHMLLDEGYSYVNKGVYAIYYPINILH